MAGADDAIAVCVYCGSSMGVDPAHAAMTTSLGAELAARHITLVYGGGAVGLMGVLADAVLHGGGQVIGVIPRGLFSPEVAHERVTRLIEVDSMHERKQMMFDLSDAFLALPGGIGTLEELAEVATWAQLGMHAKPIITVSDYWQPFHEFVDHAVRNGFMKAANAERIVPAKDVDAALELITTRSPDGPVPR